MWSDVSQQQSSAVRVLCLTKNERSNQGSVFENRLSQVLGGVLPAKILANTLPRLLPTTSEGLVIGFTGCVVFTELDAFALEQATHARIPFCITQWFYPHRRCLQNLAVSPTL